MQAYCDGCDQRLEVSLYAITLRESSQKEVALYCAECADTIQAGDSDTVKEAMKIYPFSQLASLNWHMFLSLFNALVLEGIDDNYPLSAQDMRQMYSFLYDTFVPREG